MLICQKCASIHYEDDDLSFCTSCGERFRTNDFLPDDVDPALIEARRQLILADESSSSDGASQSMLESGGEADASFENASDEEEASESKSELANAGTPGDSDASVEQSAGVNAPNSDAVEVVPESQKKPRGRRRTRRRTRTIEAESAKPAESAGPPQNQEDEDDTALVESDSVVPDDAGESESELLTVALDLDGDSPALARAIRQYVQRVERVKRGELPRSAVRPPGGLTPEIVGAALARSTWLGSWEALRNLAFLTPVLWTWYQLYRAASAYGELSADQQNRPFIALWQENFYERGGESLADTALVAVALIGVVFALTLVVHRVSGQQTRRERESAIQFAATLDAAGDFGLDREPITPAEQLDEFSRAGLELATNLRVLTETLTKQGEPLADSVDSARLVMTEMLDIVETQSAQLSSVTESLSKIAGIDERLKGLLGPVERSSAALEEIGRSLPPTIEGVDTSASQLTQVAETLDRSNGDLMKMLAELNNLTSTFTDSAQSANEMANRLADAIGNSDGR